MKYAQSQLFGKIVFFDEYIKIYNKGNLIRTIEWGEINVATFYFFEIKNSMFYTRKIVLGDENYIKINLLSDEKICYYVCLESKSELEVFKNSVLLFYENKVTVKESIGLETSYGLEILNYKQLQEFKVKYGL